MVNRPDLPEGKLMAVQMADQLTGARPLYSNYVLFTRVQEENADQVTLTFYHIFPLPTQPGTDAPMRGEPVARVQLGQAVAVKLRNLLVQHLGLTHEELDGIFEAKKELTPGKPKVTRGRRKKK